MSVWLSLEPLNVPNSVGQSVGSSVGPSEGQESATKARAAGAALTRTNSAGSAIVYSHTFVLVSVGLWMTNSWVVFGAASKRTADNAIATNRAKRHAQGA